MKTGTYHVVLVTVPDYDKAREIVGILLEKRLIACANILRGVESHFIWEGKVDSAQEILLIIKTRKSSLRAMAQCIKSLHPYDVPEIIAMPVAAGSKAYLSWINQVVR